MDSSPRRHGTPHPRFKRMIVGLFSSIFLALLLFILSILYLKYVKETIQVDSKSNLGELGKHISESLTSHIQSTNDVLESLTLELPWNNYKSEEQLTGFLQQQASFWNFHDIAYIDKDGISHHANGTLDTLSRSLISDALKYDDTVYDLQIYNDEDCVIFVAPLAPDARRETGILAVTGTYAVRNWNMLMDIDIYNHQAVTYIITNTGVIVTPSQTNSEKTSYNLLETLRGAKFEDGMNLSTIQNKLREGQRLQVAYSLDGTDYYLGCEPIGFNSWTLVFTVPSAIVNRAGINMSQSVVIIGVGLTVIFLLILLLFLAFQYRTKKALWRMAYEDEVTGGANKNRFDLNACSFLADGERSYMLVYVNICQFKMLNRRLGKQEADHILRNLYNAMNMLITPQECCGRLSADNFCLLLEKTDSPSITERLEKFAQDQAWQTTSNGNTISIRLVFGLCDASSDTYDLTRLIDQANLAMKSLSSTGEHRAAVYDASMMEKAAREKELTEYLLREDVSEEFYICLQPKVSLDTGQVVGAEALARWDNSCFGFVSPGEFIPLAEKIGMVCEIDWMAFENVCKILKSWEREGKPLIPISFNLSKAQFAIPDFLTHYRTVIEQYQVPCQYLDFEFTESMLYEDTHALQNAVCQIHEMGCLCSVDDFGFGYSSLGLLGQFEADSLKLDRSFFLGDTSPDSRNNQIVRNVIQLASSLHMKTVAEGIEDQEHVEMLRQFGCDSIQGYIFSKPLTVSNFESFVLKQLKGEE